MINETVQEEKIPSVPNGIKIRIRINFDRLRSVFFNKTNSEHRYARKIFLINSLRLLKTTRRIKPNMK